MARIDRFMIAPLNSGLQNNLKPWLIPDDAFQMLNNAYVFRGRVRKRFGSSLMVPSDGPIPGFEQLLSRLSIMVGTTDGSGDFPSTVMPGNIFKPGQLFSVGTDLFTVTALGLPSALLSSSSATGTFNTTSGALIINGTFATTAVYFYPSQPVMGLLTYQTPTVVSDKIIAFDTRFSYQFTASGWSLIGLGTDADNSLWSGTDTDFFWGYNYRGLLNSDTFLYVTNYVAADNVRYYDPNGTPVWKRLRPVINNTTYVATAKIVVPFKDRLVLLNTVEGDNGVIFIPGGSQATNGSGNFNQTVAGTYALGQQFVVGSTVYTIISNGAGLQNMQVSAYPGVQTPPTAQFNFMTGNLVITGNGNNINTIVYYFSFLMPTTTTFTNRCRFSLNGDPTRPNGWLEATPGLGGYIDAPTKEAIVTAQFLKDRLIVYFEASTWELVYTRNQVLPFVWQQINTEFGAESTFSQVPFDKVVLGVGNVGIVACNGSNVDRIDDNIPDEVFDIHNYNNSVNRVFGIRDYFVEMVYWAFPDTTRSSATPYNNKVLVYNYKNGSWAVNDDSITAFGYFQSATGDEDTWALNTDTWETADYEWNSGNDPIQVNSRTVIAGNQQGFVFIIDADEGRNSPALQITNMTQGANPNMWTISCINHNLEQGYADGDTGVANGDYILIENVIGVTGFSASSIYPVYSVTDKDTIVINAPLTGSYAGGGTIARISNIQIQTKQYNFYVDQGRNALINKVDFLVDKTSNGEITVDYSISASSESQLVQGEENGSNLGTGVLDTKPYDLVRLEQTQDRLWHPIYPMAEGECIQMNLYFNERQITDIDIALSDFELHAMIFNASATSSRLQ